MAVAFCMTWAGSAVAAEKLVQKVDNFIFFIDYSGSMGFKYMDTGEKKIELAKQSVKAVNQEIPELDYQSSLLTFAPYSKMYPSEGAAGAYSTSDYGNAVDYVSTNFNIYGRLTPMGPDTYDLDPVLQNLSGKTAVIIVSDGLDNLGIDAVEATRDIYNRYPGSVCFHVISFATKPEGEATLSRIAELRDCSVMVRGEDILGSEANAEQFARDVFYDVVIEKEKMEPEPEPTPQVEPEVEDVISLRSVHFDFDKSNIRPDMRPILDEAARLIKQEEGDLMLEGHTDSIGTEEYNMGLGRRRANSVKQYLIDKGVDANRLDTKSYGESQPKYTNETAEGRALNRRVELRFK
jgi:OOP family OmpA-OmpF porin